MGLLEQIYRSRVGRRGEWHDAPQRELTVVFKNLLLELLLYGGDSTEEAGAVAYLTTIFQVTLKRLQLAETIKLEDPEATLTGVLDSIELDKESILDIINDYYETTDNAIPTTECKPSSTG